MPTRDENFRTREEKILKARALRAEHAAAAALYAHRVEQARAASRCAAIGHWTKEYRHAAARCRLLGELIRTERAEAERAAASAGAGGPAPRTTADRPAEDRGATALRLVPQRPGQPIRSTGEAA